MREEMVWSTNRVELRVDVVGVLDLPLEAREDSIRGLFERRQFRLDTIRADDVDSPYPSSPVSFG